jgi:excinuclease ABC subunit B
MSKKLIDNKFELESKYNPSADQEIAIDSLTTRIKEEDDRQVLLGVTGSGKTYVMANIIERLNRPTLILSHNKTLAAQLYEEFNEFFPNNAVKYFVSYYDYYQPEAYIPGKDLYIEKEADVNKEIEKFRMSAMNSALTRRDLIVVASVSCIYNIGDPGNFKRRAITIKVGDRFSPSQLSRELSFMQYERDLTDFTPGSFRVKGDVIDIFMPYEDNPIRIELWGEDVESIGFIDSLTGQKLLDLKEIEIFPSKNFIFDPEIVNNAINAINAELVERVKFLNNIGKNLEAQRLEQRTRYDIEMLREVGYCKGMENYSVFFEERGHGSPPYTLMDYFPEDYLLFIDESHITVPQIGGMFNGDKARKQTLIDYGFRLPSATDNRPLNFTEFQERQGYTVYVSATPNEWEIKDSNKSVTELLTRPTGLLDPIIDIRPSENQIDDVINEVDKTIKKGQRVLITTLTKKMSEDLADHLTEFGIKVHYLHSGQDTVERIDVLRDLRLGEYDVLVGINLLREGIDLPEVSLVIILDADKEGFLRSKTSLVQTIGRAARHQEGRVILYADKYTDSMNYAISETKRRREYQNKYNEKHGITPKTIQKDIRDKMIERAEEEEINYEKWVEESKPPAKEINRLIKDLEGQMFIASSNLQYEKAARLRDQIRELKGTR